MELLFTMVVPLTIAGVAMYGLGRGVDVYDALVQGAGGGLEVMLRIFPALVGLMTAVAMLRASGALELAAEVLAPLLDRVGLPAQLLPLMLVRPISGSAALGVGGRAHTDLWSGLSAGADRGSYAGLHRDHLLYHCRLFWRGRNYTHPLCGACRPVCRSYWVSGGGLGGADLFFIKKRPPKGPWVNPPIWRWDRCAPCARPGSAGPEVGSGR